MDAVTATKPLIDPDILSEPSDFVILIPTENEAEGIFPGIDFHTDAYGIRKSSWRGWPVYATGVGKANAAVTAALVFSTLRPKRVLLAGIAGAYRGFGLEVGRVAAVSVDHFVDDGMLVGGRMRSMTEIGFPICPGDRVSFRPLAGCVSMQANTVSLLSATDGLARMYQQATGAAMESMEGAAVGLAASRMGIEISQIRAISNFCGERTMQEWDVPAAFISLRSALSSIIDPIS